MTDVPTLRHFYAAGHYRAGSLQGGSLQVAAAGARLEGPKAEAGVEFTERDVEPPPCQLEGSMISHCFGHWKRPFLDKKSQP